MGSAAGMSTAAAWREAVDQATGMLPPGNVDVLVAFVSYHHVERFPEVLTALNVACAPRMLIGCSSQGVIATGREVEGRPGLSLLALDLPGATLQAVRVTSGMLAANETAAELAMALDVARPVRGWVLITDPFSFDSERLIELLSEAYPGVPIVGGMATGFPNSHTTYVFEGEQVHDDGAVLLAVGGDWAIRPIVSQGAAPIGQPWTVTAATGSVVETIGGRPALEVLVETVQALPEAERARAAQNLLVGLAMDEYRDDFSRGDFLIRNLLGVDRERSLIAVGDQVRVGQTLQFQVRDAAAADDELAALLAEAREDVGDRAAAGLLYACNGRGQGLFGTPSHDASAIERAFGELPLAGLFCNGEIGPVGGRTFVHGFTASLALFVPAES